MRGRKPDHILVDADAIEHAKAPAWLPKDAKAEWRRVLPLLAARQVLTGADLMAFASYCAAVGQLIEAQKIVAREGLTFMGATGPKKHPAVAVMNDAQTQARLLAAELGLTPVSRSRPSIRDEGQGGDDASDLGL
jgi:P27 family predicted phage terminase small subunit